MSDLFDSLNFHTQWPPQCSPTILSTASLANASTSKNTSTSATVLRTPDQRADASAGSSGGDSECIARSDGRVYWYAPPSPSLQLQQIEQQRRLAASGRLQPLASQAFRDELLTTTAWASASSSAASASNARKRLNHRRASRRSHSNGTAQNGHNRALHEALGIERIMSDLDQHLTHGDSGCIDKLKHGDDYDDENDSECTALEQDKENLERQLIEGMDRAFSQEDEREAIRRQRRKQKVLCQAFEENDDVSTLTVSSAPLPALRTSKWARTVSMPVHVMQPSRQDSEQDGATKIANVSTLAQPSPLSAKHIALAATTRLGKRSLPHSPSNNVQAAHARRSNSVSGFDGVGNTSPSKPIARPARTSPHKRCAVLAAESDGQQGNPRSPSLQRRAGMARTVSEGAQHLPSTCFPGGNLLLGVAKTNPTKAAAVASVGVKKTMSTPMSRVPRVGLSRTSTGPGHLRTSTSQAVRSAQQTSGSTRSTNGTSPAFSGPSAPFKQPTRRSPRKQQVQRSDASLPVTAGSQASAIKANPVVVVLEDSSDDEVARRRSTAVRQTEDRAINAKAMVPPVTSHDGDSSFDTSLDEMALCEALEQVEASQEAIRASQQQQQQQQHSRCNSMTTKTAQHTATKLHASEVAPGSDDSFASLVGEDDDDVSAAILCRMDAEGW